MDFSKIPAFRLDEEHAAASPLLAFAGRDGYLSWVADWKVALHATIADIRAAKRRRRDPDVGDEGRNAANLERQALRDRAFNLLALRKAGRDKSKLQRDASRLAVAA
jgi:hypothetical protein